MAFDGTDSWRGPVILSLGGFDNLVTALLPDGGVVQIPYDRIGEVPGFLAFLLKLGAAVVVENPLVIAVELDEDGEAIGPSLRERLLMAQAVREALRELDLDLVEVEGSTEKYFRCPYCGERVEPAERYIVYRETPEDYEEFRCNRDSIIEQYIGSLEEISRAASEPLLELLLIPLRALVGEEARALERWLNPGESKELRDLIYSSMIARFEGKARIGVVARLYSLDDLLEDKMEKLAFTVAAVMELPEYRVYERLVIRGARDLPKPSHKSLESYVETRILFIPVVILWYGTILEFERAYSSIDEEVLRRAGEVVMNAYKLESVEVGIPCTLDEARLVVTRIVEQLEGMRSA